MDVVTDSFNNSSVSIKTIEGHPIMVPNKVVQCNKFYISYNNYDTDIYGSDTTALVLGVMEKFYILNGDHRKNYNALKDKGFEACFEYFKNNSDLKNKNSD